MKEDFMSFQKIDMETFPRRKHFEYFCSLPYPYVGMTTNVDVTELILFCKKHHYSFFLTFLHIVALSANDTREFRQRIRNKGIIEYDFCSTSHVELLDDGTYCYCRLRHDMPLDVYMPYARNGRKLAQQQRCVEDDDSVDEMFFISSVPWIHYTALIQPVACGEESNPRISWGKIEKDFNGRDQMPVTVLVHHGLADGIHIAQFYQNLDKRMQEIMAAD